jgi:hypothetical protein
LSATPVLTLPGTEHYRPSPALAHAPDTPQVVAARYTAGGTMYQDFSPAGVATGCRRFCAKRPPSSERKAETKGEKATIEIVALMFQAILAEDRIPPGIRRPVCTLADAGAAGGAGRP